MSLREGLASWFKAVHHRHEHGIGGYCETCAGLVPADKSANDMVWFVMADECIRQMEWARRELMESVKDYLPDLSACGCDVREYGSHREGCWRVPPTIAPEDWKP